MDNPTQAVLFCGGLGTRLKPLTDSLPKPMVPIHNKKPFLYYLLEQIAEQGIKKFVLLTGYMAEVISDYFGDGSKWGWEISYSNGPIEWDTGRRLWEAKSLLDKQFLLFYSDNFAAFSLDAILRLKKENDSIISLLITTKANGNVSLGKNNILEKYDRTRKSSNLDYVELGYMAVDRDKVFCIYEYLQNSPNVSFSDIIENLVEKRAVSGHLLETPYFSISDPNRLELMRKHLSPKKILLLDRDGTIHQKAPQGEYISKWEDVHFLPQAVEGLVRLAKDGFSFIVISNQAGVGRGMISQHDVNELNRKISEYFSSIGVEILNFYVCPHHWEDNCDCRKPKPGMFYKCAADHDLRLDRVLYVGDDPRDCQAAKTAGSKCLFVGNPDELKGDLATEHNVYSSILDAFDDIISFYNAR